MTTTTTARRSAEAADLVVIGAGGGGYPAAFLCDEAGRRVVMIDPIGNLGGDCPVEGCVPSKAAREVSLLRARARRYAALGWSEAPPRARCESTHAAPPDRGVTNDGKG